MDGVRKSMNEILHSILQEFGITSSFSQALFLEKSTLKSYPKFKDIFSEGRRNDREYILLSGVLHRYNLTEKGDIVTTGFYLPHSIITPHFARTAKGKSIFSLQTLTDVSLAEIPVPDLDNLRQNNKEFHEFGQHVLEREISRAYLGEVVFRTNSAKERLLFLRKNYPNIENLIPHAFIASFLGITHVSFSRLRNELSKP